MPSNWKGTFSALMPEKIHPQEAKDFHHISVCNTLYKIAGKVLVPRLDGIMNHLIIGEQRAFIQRRQILDNILTVQEMLHPMEIASTRSALTVLKINIERAYDRIKWTFEELF